MARLADGRGIRRIAAVFIARQLIAEHGEDVARVLQDKIDALMDSRDFEQLSEWFAIRNAVAITLSSDSTLQ